MPGSPSCWRVPRRSASSSAGRRSRLSPRTAWLAWRSGRSLTARVIPWARTSKQSRSISFLSSRSPAAGARRSFSISSQPSFLRPRRLQRFPRGIGQEQKVVEFSGPAQPLPAVDDHALAVDVLHLIAQQEGRQVGQLLVPAKALHRVGIAGVLLELL